MQDSGEIPVLHVYELEPAVTPATAGETKAAEAGSGSIPKALAKYSYLALSQRKLDFVPGPFLHPFQLVVFGSPLLLRVQNMEGYTGMNLYSLVSKRMRQHFVPTAPTTDRTTSSNVSYVDKEAWEPAARQARRGRLQRQKTTADMESVSAGDIPLYGFRLRLVSRDGSRCALCPWFGCCVGCLIPCDDRPVIAMCGDSVAIDWHLSVDLSCGGFGWKISATEGAGINIQASPHTRALARVKKHSSFDLGGKKYGYSGSITLEECLDSFAEEERIPDVRRLCVALYCYLRFHGVCTDLSCTFLSDILFTMPRATGSNKETEHLEIPSHGHYPLETISVHGDNEKEVERSCRVPNRGARFVTNCCSIF